MTLEISSKYLRRELFCSNKYLLLVDLTIVFQLCDIFILVDTEEYPSLAEGIGLENRQAGHTARGFESLFLLHF